MIVDRGSVVFLWGVLLACASCGVAVGEKSVTDTTTHHVHDIHTKSPSEVLSAVDLVSKASDIVVATVLRQYETKHDHGDGTDTHFAVLLRIDDVMKGGLAIGEKIQLAYWAVKHDDHDDIHMSKGQMRHTTRRNMFALFLNPITSMSSYQREVLDEANFAASLPQGDPEPPTFMPLEPNGIYFDFVPESIRRLFDPYLAELDLSAARRSEL